MKKASGIFFFLALTVIIATSPLRANGNNNWNHWGNNGDPSNVPEPATLALLASGVGALAVFRRTRAKK